MIRIKGKLTDAAGNPLPCATIEFYSKRNAGNSLSGASAVCRTDQGGNYAFSLKEGEFEVFAQVSGSTDVSYIGDCAVDGEMLDEETLESLMEMSAPILPESVLEVRQLTSQVRSDKERVESLSYSVDEKHQSVVNLESQALAHTQSAKESKNSAAQSSQTAQQAASETQGVFEAAAKVDSDAKSASDSASLATQKAQQAEASAQSAAAEAKKANTYRQSASSDAASAAESLALTKEQQEQAENHRQAAANSALLSKDHAEESAQQSLKAQERQNAASESAARAKESELKAEDAAQAHITAITASISTSALMVRLHPVF